MTGLSSGGAGACTSFDQRLHSAITVSGRVDGHRVQEHEDGCWSRKTYVMLQKLRLDPEPPHRDATLAAGERRTFTAAAMRAVHLSIHCHAGGSGALIQVPLPKGWPTSVAYEHEGARLTVAVDGSGAVAAGCSVASYHVATLEAGQEHTFSPAAMSSVGQVVRCSSHGSVVQIGSRARPDLPPFESLYPRTRHDGRASLTEAYDNGTVTATCT